jgi:NAD(P)-dependent dehydrogenase (short-subunit alcohol dehydrogenase family)
MANDESGNKSALTSTGRERRRFLQRTVVATAGASAAAALPGLCGATPPATSATPSGSACADLKAPMRDVEGKVAFITGGSSGIGLGIARAFVDAGMKVVITYRSAPHLDEAMKVLAGAGDRVHAVSLDVTDRAAMEAAAAEAVKRFGKVHVLVNNAGIVAMPTLVNTTYADWDLVMNVNVNGVFNGVHTFLPLIRAHNEGGQIITTSSLGGLWITIPVHGAYYVSKFAITGMMEALRVELMGSNIGVSVYCAGPVKTHLADASLRPSDEKERNSKDMEEKDLFRVHGLDASKIAIEPIEAGQAVLEGMRSNRLYILTSPEFAPNINERNEAILASFSPRIHPNETQVKWARAMGQNSIYTAETHRIRCAHASSAKSKA